MAWCAALAHLHDAPLMPGVLIGLGLSVWIFYLLDRLVDDLRPEAGTAQRRQAFLQRWKVVLIIAIVTGSALVAWLALWLVPQGLMWECVSLGILMMLYLAVIQSGGKHWTHVLLIPLASPLALVMTHSWPLPPAFQFLATGLILLILLLNLFSHLRQQMGSMIVKDVMGGMLFALGCTAWARFIQASGEGLNSTLELWLLGCLFIGNLTGLSSREAQSRWLALGFGSVVGVLALVMMQPLSASLGILAEACGIGLLLMLFLIPMRRTLSDDAYRVWIDLAVLAPALYLWIRT
jgi:hypothetical protein